MANSISHARLPYPILNSRFTLIMPFLDADGDPVDPTSLDTELSLDNGAFADAAEEVTLASGSHGMGMLTLTGAETNNSAVGVFFGCATAKATLATLYPRNLAIVGSGTLSAGSAGGGTLGTLLAYDVTGCFIRTTGGTGGGGTGGAANQARRIITYVVSSGAFTVSPNWETTPDNTTTYDVLLPEGVTLGMLKTLNPTTPGNTLDVTSTGAAGIDWGNVENKTTTNDLTGTNIKIDQKVDLNTIKTQSVTCAASVTILASVGTAATSTAQTGDVFARVGAPAGASVSADVAAVKADTAGIKTRTDLALPAVAPAANGGLGTVDANNYIAGIAGTKNQLDDLNDVSSATVNTEADTALADYGALQPTTAGRKLDVSAGGEGGLDWANIGGKTTVNDLSGTTVKTATDVEADTQDIQARIPAALTANGNIKADALRVGGTVQTGGDLAALLVTLTGYVDTEIAAILAAVDTEVADIRTRVLLALPAAAADGAGGLPISDAGGLDIDTLLARLDAAVTTRATPAQVNAEVVDGLNVDTYAEPGQAAWAATLSLAAKIGFLAKLARNKVTQDTTTLKIYNDDAATVDQKATVSDSGTVYTRGEIGTGP